MKKIIRILGIFLVLILVIGCSNPVGQENREETPEIPSPGIELELEDIENTTNIYIYRLYHGTTKLDCLINASNANGNKIIDYFVTPGETYDYVLTYFNESGNNYTKLHEKKILGVKANGGVGVLSISDVSFTYDNKTGIMEFSTLPNLKEQIEKIDAIEKDPTITYEYSPQDNYDYYFKGKINYDTKKIDWVKLIKDANAADIALGKTLNFTQVNIEPTIDGVCYEKIFTKEQLKANNCTVIESLVIPDDGVKPEVLLNDKGNILIKLGEIPTNCREIVISRRDVQTNKEDNDYIYIPLDNKDSPIIDYFVTPNTQYQYKINYNCNNWSDNVATKYSDPITATNGVSNLTFNNFQNVTYNAATTIMTFNTKPDFTEQLKALKQFGINITDKDINIELFYNSTNNDNGNHAIGIFNKKDGTINWSESLGREQWMARYYDTDLTLESLSIYTAINNITYNSYLSREAILSKFPTFPDTIKVQDLREKTNIKAVTNGDGIEISLANMPLDCNRVYIDKTNLSTNDYFENYMILEPNHLNGKRAVIDYFVDSNKEYKYRVRYTCPNENIEFPFSNPISINNGKGEMNFNYTPTASYDKSTGIITFGSTFDKSSISPNTVQLSDFNLEFQYGPENENSTISFTLRQNTKSINCADVFSYNQWASSWLGQDLILKCIKLNFNIDGVMYTKFYHQPLSNFQSINKINVPKTL